MAELRASGWKRFWEDGHWWKAAIAVVGYLVLYQLAGLGIGALFGDLIDTDNLFATPASVFVAIGAGLVVGSVILIAFLASVSWFRPIFSRQPVERRWWMWIFVALAVTPIVMRLVGIDYASYGVPVVLTTLGVGLLVGFVEELLYRGIAVKILRDAGHGEKVVAVVSSALFALSHSVNLLSGQPIVTVAVTVVFTFGFGMMMYLVMRATGNIVWAMLVHGMTDPTTFLATGGVDSDSGAAHSAILGFAGIFNFIFVVAALVAILLIRGKATRQG